MIGIHGAVVDGSKFHVLVEDQSTRRMDPLTARRRRRLAANCW